MTDGYTVIAGGAGNLGRVLARRIMATGEDVVVLDRHPSGSPGAVDIAVDLVDDEAVRVTLEALTAQRGAPRALVNAQGWSPKPGGSAAAEAVEPKLFREVIEVNLTSCYTTMRVLLPVMAQRGSGRVVNVGSAAAYTGRTTATSAYSAAKAGLDALTRSFAVEYASRGVLVCGVAPGKFASPGWVDDAAAVEHYRSEIPVGRLASVDEVSEAILFLASSRNTYITGQTVVVDGGRLA